MQLLASWKQSLSIFYSLNNLKLFAFAILRAVQVAAPQFLIYGGWLIIPLIAGHFLGFKMDYIVTPFIFVCTYLVVRPSVSIKNFAYWKEHSRHLFVGILFLGLLELIVLPILALQPFLLDETIGLFIKSLAIIVILLIALLMTILSIAAPFWFLFFCDSRATFGDFFSSWKRAFLMVAYAFPLWLVLVVVISPPVFATAEGSLSRLIVAFSFQFIGACIWSVIYIKQLHEQFELYFPGLKIKE